jgi:hypothetical protein
MDGWQKAVHDHYRNSSARDHQPHSPAVRDAQRKAMDARREMIDRATSAWRSTAAPLLPDARDKAITARDQKIQQMRNAWRKPFRDAPQPDTSNLDPDNDDDNGQDAVERRRSREHDARKVRLAEAWRGSPTPPPPLRSSARARCGEAADDAAALRASAGGFSC